MIQQIISQLVEGRDLTRDEAAAAMRTLMTGEATPAQIGAFLVALRMKKETIDEITGFAATMRELVTPVKTSRRPLVDTCGTGGDHSGTFNISTASAFVAAGAGCAVAKHGNRSASSQCGSADVLEALGVNINCAPDRVGRCIDDAGIGFLFAPILHVAMKHVGGARRELKLRTVFNILGPLTNPAGACGQVLGVFDPALAEPMARVLANLGTRHAFVVAGLDGLDEIALSGSSLVAEAQGGSVKTYMLDPCDLGFARAPREALAGGDAAHNAQLLKAVLEGGAGPRRDIVVVNAAAAIIAGSVASDWKTAVEAAQRSIDSGAALEKLNALVQVSHDDT